MKTGPTMPPKPWTELAFDQFGLHATLQVKTSKLSITKAGGSRVLTIVLTRDKLGKRSRPDVLLHHLTWDARQILSTYAHRWAIECTFENCQTVSGSWKTPPIAFAWR